MYCSKCKTKKGPFVAYSKNQQGKQYYRCNLCNTAHLKRYRKTKVGMANTKKAVYKSIKKHQNKQNARALVHYHISVGNLCKPSRCQKCSKKITLQAHHEDYLQPLKVRWLCRPCHDIEHR